MPEPMSVDEAVAIAREIGEALGGKQQRALEVLIQSAQRTTRKASTQHFVKAQEELAAGMEAAQSTRTIRVAPEEPSTDRILRPASVPGREDP